MTKKQLLEATRAINVTPPVVWNRSSLADGDKMAVDSNFTCSTFNLILNSFAQKEIGQLVFLAYQSDDPDLVLCDGRLLNKADYPILYSKLGDTYSTSSYTDQFNEEFSITPKTPTIEQFCVPYALGLSPVGINSGTIGFNANGVPGQIYGDKTRKITGSMGAVVRNVSGTGAFTNSGNGDGFAGGGHGWERTFYFDSSRVVPTGVNGTSPSFACYTYIQVSFTVEGLGTTK